MRKIKVGDVVEVLWVDTIMCSHEWGCNCLDASKGQARTVGYVQKVDKEGIELAPSEIVNRGAAHGPEAGNPWRIPRGCIKKWRVRKSLQWPKSQL
ncbi:hypothetical protein LCGC14_2686160 [marine sediment metagenome]|uniref:Uncharacterized protein n=1 Tax=marine sediment metagenome TaxID=412755 RepID=A0A0F8ZJX8_9ZZZZ